MNARPGVAAAGLAALAFAIALQATAQAPPHPAAIDADRAPTPAMPAATAPTPAPGSPVVAVPPTQEKKAAAMPEAMRERLAAFIAEIWPDAQRRGVSRQLFERAFAGLEPEPEIFELLANQPELVAAPWDYLARLASERRIETGRAKLAEHADLLSRIEAHFGVDRHVVLAIWGIESNFGAAQGSRHVVRSLATLAVGEPRRAPFWRAELIAALAILERGDIPLERMTGSWAGAMGHTQFMPTSYLAHAVDFDGDGRRDIWDSVPDALASTAGYLRSSGWTAGEVWGIEVVLPAGFDFAMARPGTALPLSQWLAAGIAPPAGGTLPSSPSAFSLLLPAGARGPAFLVSPAFRAILRYNNAVPYALAVGHLADRIRGAGPLAGLWPHDDPPLNRERREELQRRLAALGFDVGPVDGVIGNGTRAAIRAFQARSGMAEDGWAGEQLLQRLREAGG